MTAFRAVILTLLALILLVYVFQLNGNLSYTMPDWNFSGIELHERAAPAKVADVPAEVPLAAQPPVTASTSSNKLVVTTDKALAIKSGRYAARGGQTWDNIAIKTTSVGIGWAKSGTQCRIPAGGIVRKMEQWPSPEGDLDTYWRIQYVSQKNAIIENPPPMFYCAIGSSQSISDTLLETYYTPAQ